MSLAKRSSIDRSKRRSNHRFRQRLGNCTARKASPLKSIPPVASQERQVGGEGWRGELPKPACSQTLTMRHLIRKLYR